MILNESPLGHRGLWSGYVILRHKYGKMDWKRYIRADSSNEATEVTLSLR
jgi:hypothetical protein